MGSLLETLSGSLGNDAVVPPDRVGEYTVDGVTPEAAVFPETVEKISEVMSHAAREGKMVVPWGGGTQMALGNRPRGVDLVLGLGRLNRILFHEPGDLVAGVQAGMTLDALQEELAVKGQFLPLEAPLPSRATIGGILASNAGGSSRLAYGTARDWIIGIKVAGFDGTLTKAGGRVVKNVTGYDLNKLYIGSLGTLGVILEATFKLAPLPQDRATVVAPYRSLPAALSSARELLKRGFQPQALHVVNAEVMGRLQGPAMTDGAGAVLLALLAGRKVAVQGRADELAGDIAGGAVGPVERLSSEEGAGIWQALTDLGWGEVGPSTEGSKGSPLKSLPYLTARTSVLPSRVRDVLDLSDSLEPPALRQGVAADAGTGLVRLLWWPREGLPYSIEEAEGLIGGLRQGVSRLGGHLVVERCPLELKSKIDVWGDPPEGMVIMRRIKDELDPAGILSPGRFVGGI